MKERLLESPPILVIFFNRPDCLKKLLIGLIKSGVKKIYLASDGPRGNCVDDVPRIKACRELVDLFSSQFKTVNFYYSQENFGCDTFVPKAISWFFSHEESGIILEDDCIIDEGFLRFADFALRKYRDDQRIMCISAANFQSHIIGDGDYFFSRYPYIWGWATWSRAWKYYQDDASILSKEFSFDNCLDKIFKNRRQSKHWKKMLSYLAIKKIIFWDAKWYFSMWSQGGISITPNINLVSNIGFGEDATHTKSERENPNMFIGKLPHTINSPSEKILNNDADHELFKRRFSPTLFGYLRVARSKLLQLLNI